MTDIRSFTIPSKPRSKNLQGSGTVVYSGGGGSSSGSSGGGGSIDLSGYAKLSEDNLFTGGNTFRSLTLDNTRPILYIKSSSQLKSAVGYYEVDKCFVIQNLSASKELRIYDDGRFEYDKNTIYHAGNANNYNTEWKAKQIILGEGSTHTRIAGIVDDGVYISSDDPNFIPNLTVTGKIYADDSYLVYNEGNANRLDIPWNAESLATGSLIFGEQDNEINARDYGDLYVGFRNTNMVYLGKDCNVGIGMNPLYKLDVNGDVRTNVFFQAGNFASGWTGNGCRMEAGGKMECTNLWVRGSMNVYELIINQLNATNGSFAVTDSGKVASVDSTLNKFTLTGDNNNFNTFRMGDLLKCQKYTGRIVKAYTIRVFFVSGLEVTYVYMTGGADINVIEPGDTLIRWDSTNANRKGLLYLTSSDSNAPYMDVMNSQKMYVRLGNLTGVGNLSGYGIVGRDSELNNVFYISSDGNANIAGWSFDKNTLWVGDKQINNAFTNSGVTIHSSGAIRSKAFRLEADGSTFLGKGNQLISYNATSGKIEFGSEVSLNWSKPIDDANTLIEETRDGVTELTNEYVGKTTYIDVNGIYTGTLSARQINAINVRGESLTFVKGTIAGWNFDNDALWIGDKQTNNAFSTSGITISSGGAIRSKTFRLETDGMSYIGNGAKVGDFYIVEGAFSSFREQDANQRDAWFNMSKSTLKYVTEIYSGDIKISENATAISSYGVTTSGNGGFVATNPTTGEAKFSATQNRLVLNNLPKGTTSNIGNIGYHPAGTVMADTGQNSEGWAMLRVKL